MSHVLFSLLCLVSCVGSRLSVFHWSLLMLSPGAPPSPDADNLVKKTFYFLKIMTEYKISRIQSPSNFKTARAVGFASSSCCHLIMPLCPWCWQSAAEDWNKTREEAKHRHFPAARCSSFCCFSCQWSQTLKKWFVYFKEPLDPACVHSLSSSCLYLCCSALLEQLSRLQALLPNSSSKAKHRGTCILVRHITQHYIHLRLWGFAQTA